MMSCSHFLGDWNGSPPRSSSVAPSIKDGRKDGGFNIPFIPLSDESGRKPYIWRNSMGLYERIEQESLINKQRPYCPSWQVGLSGRETR